jgi:alanine-synthesizing transaminase
VTTASPRSAASRAIVPARRTEKIRYAVRDIVVLAEEVARTGREMLYLNIGDPNLFDFAPPPHVVRATHEAMLANHNGYAPSSGIPAAPASARSTTCASPPARARRSTWPSRRS